MSTTARRPSPVPSVGWGLTHQTRHPDTQAVARFVRGAANSCGAGATSRRPESARDEMAVSLAVSCPLAVYQGAMAVLLCCPAWANRGGHDWARTSDLTDVNRETTLLPHVAHCCELLPDTENGKRPCHAESS